jgi:tryptophan-rich sensory protein
MKKTLPTLTFLLLNFAALAVGGLFTGNGVSSEWHQNLDKAPWTPPGWVLLLVIVGLLLSVLLIAIKFSRIQKSWTLAIVPYVLWLLVATSLNAYIFFKM